jgi:hypothetical protein
MIEKLLGILDGDEVGTRVELVQVAEPNQTPTLELRMQREVGDLGWSTQRRIKLGAGQFAQLRDALNCMDLDAREARACPQRAMEQRGLRLIG